MSKLGDFLKHFKNKYDEEQKRLMRMDKFLDRAEENTEKLHEMIAAVDNLSGKMCEVESKVDKLQDHVTHIDGRLAIIGEGTKMELFDTLYHWKKILVDDRGWASAVEKKEVKDIYEVYHDGLDGNGQGKVYFEQIMNLPETPPSNS